MPEEYDVVKDIRIQFAKVLLRYLVAILFLVAGAGLIYSFYTNGGFWAIPLACVCFILAFLIAHNGAEIKLSVPGENNEKQNKD